MNVFKKIIQTSEDLSKDVSSKLIVDTTSKPPTSSSSSVAPNQRSPYFTKRKSWNEGLAIRRDSAPVLTVKTDIRVS